MRWPRLRPQEIAALLREPVDEATMAEAATIVNDVRAGGEASLRHWAERFGELNAGAPLTADRGELCRHRDALAAAERELLERTAERIAVFAAAQRAAIEEVTVAVPGGRAGHTVAAVARAGCYAPGGRYPLPSSVLMTAVTARVAGVDEVWVASPRPTPLTFAAAAIAGADGLLMVGGAHAIAALAYGAGAAPRCDVVVGPGNRWVTAAKKLVSGAVGIEMLAGPSELVVLADDSADPALVAADLLAQAEHDPDARPLLVTAAHELADAVERELGRQLGDLPTAEVATAALASGGAVLAGSLDEAITLCDLIAPEHLEVVTREAATVGRRLRSYGALFIGGASAEVFGDYGVGPNHTLPTGGSARYASGLSVLSFLRLRTWLEMGDGPGLAAIVDDAAHLARLEGLEAHARAAEARTARSRPAASAPGGLRCTGR